jgi:hypothetical protein
MELGCAVGGREVASQMKMTFKLVHLDVPVDDDDEGDVSKQKTHVEDGWMDGFQRRRNISLYYG